MSTADGDHQAERTRAYWVCAPGRGELREACLPAEAALGPGQCLVRAEWSGVSAGTERLVGRGEVPPDGAQAMACRHMEGDFSLPVKYGYCLVGRVETGALRGRRVFVMHPHQELALVPEVHCTVLPESLPGPRALAIPNLETALNAIWDAELKPDEAVLVVGAGLVGVLLGYVHHRLLGEARCTLVDSDPERRKRAAELPWVREVCAPEELQPGRVAVAFHATGHPAGLQTALDAVGFEGRVLELSWYGERRVELDLGMAFHHDRKRLIASQVGHIAPAKRATHGFDDRLREVLTLLESAELDALPGTPIAFEELPAFMAGLYGGARVSLLPTVAYGGSA